MSIFTTSKIPNNNANLRNELIGVASNVGLNYSIVLENYCNILINDGIPMNSIGILSYQMRDRTIKPFSDKADVMRKTEITVYDIPIIRVAQIYENNKFYVKGEYISINE